MLTLTLTDLYPVLPFLYLMVFNAILWGTGISDVILLPLAQKVKVL